MTGDSWFPVPTSAGDFVYLSPFGEGFYPVCHITPSVMCPVCIRLHLRPLAGDATFGRARWLPV